MSLLKINNLGITLSELLFTDLSFNLNKGDMFWAGVGGLTLA